MDRVRARVKDKRVLALVKAFLKAGVLTELGERRDTLTGTPQGGILSPLIFNIAMTALDEHLMAPWKGGGAMATGGRRQARRRRGLPNWRIVRYADDFAVLVNGSEQDAQALREDIARVLATMGLRLSEAKTRVVHMSEGFSFLGFRIQWRRKRGTAKWHVYTFIDDRPVRSVKDKIRTLTPRTSQLDLGYVLTRLNQVMHGWASYFRHAVAKNTFSMLDNFAWWRVISMLMERHRRRWKDVRRWLVTPAGSWRPITAGETGLRRIAAIPVTRYRYRGSDIPGPWSAEPA
jgi:RNA-directed DNA polymerase